MYKRQHLEDADNEAVKTFLEKWIESTEFRQYWQRSNFKGIFEEQEAIKSCKSVHGFTHSIGTINVEERLIPNYIKHLTVRRLTTDNEFKAYREYNLRDQGMLKQPVIGYFNDLEKISEIASTPGWSRYYQVLSLSEQLASKGRLCSALDQIHELEVSQQHQQFKNSPGKLQLCFYKMKGLIYLRLENFPKAIDSFDCVKDTEKDAECLAYKAQALSAIDMYDKAYDAAILSFGLDPGNPTILATYIMLHLLMGRIGEIFEKLDWEQSVLKSKPVILSLIHI